MTVVCCQVEVYSTTGWSLAQKYPTECGVSEYYLETSNRELSEVHQDIHVDGHDRKVFVILAKYCKTIPDDGSSVIRNMSEQF